MSVAQLSKNSGERLKKLMMFGVKPAQDAVICTSFVPSSTDGV